MFWIVWNFGCLESIQQVVTLSFIAIAALLAIFYVERSLKSSFTPLFKTLVRPLFMVSMLFLAMVLYSRF